MFRIKISKFNLNGDDVSLSLGSLTQINISLKNSPSTTTKDNVTSNVIIESFTDF